MKVSLLLQNYIQYILYVKEMTSIEIYCNFAKYFLAITAINK